MLGTAAFLVAQDAPESPLVSDRVDSNSSISDENSAQSTSAIAPEEQLNAAPAYIPLSLEQKWLYSVSQVFGPSHLAAYTAHAIFDQICDLPKQWGRTADSAGARVLAHLGNSLTRNNIQFAVQALDHEDPRYFRSNLHGARSRTRYALIHTFIVRRDDGAWMPAYSTIVTDYVSPYIVRQWRPERFRNMDALQAGTAGIGFAMGANVFNEFWPDLRKKLRKAPFLRNR